MKKIMLAAATAVACLPGYGAVKITRVAAEGGSCEVVRPLPGGSGWLAVGMGEQFVILDPAASGDGIIGEKLLDGRVTDIAFRDSLAYVTCQAGGLRVLDISDRKSIREVSSFPFVSSAPSVSVLGNSVFVTDWNGKTLDIFDASASGAPVLVKAYPLLNNPNHFTAIGNRGYLTFGGFQILDLSDLGKPAILNPTLPGTYVNLAIRDSLAFTSGEGWTAIHNVADPKNIRQVSVIRDYHQPFGCASDGVAVAEGVAYLATCDSAYNATTRGTLRAFDVSNPAKPVALCTLSLSESPVAINLQGERALVAEGDGGFQIVDLANRDSLRLAGSHPAQHAVDVAMIGGHAFTVDSHNGVQIYDLAIPDSPKRVGGFPLHGARRIEADGNRLFVLGDSLVLLDAGDPLHLIERARYSRRVRNFSPTGTRVFALPDDGCCLAGPATTVNVLDFSAPGEMRLQSEFGVVGYTETLKIAGDTLYIGENYNDIRAINISDPANPVFLGKVAFQANDIQVEGNLLYLSGNNLGVSIVDRATMKVVGTYKNSTVGADKIRVAQGRLYVAGIYGGGTLAVEDVTNPAVPVDLGSRMMPAVPLGMAVFPGYLLVATDMAGLQVLKIEDGPVTAVHGGRTASESARTRSAEASIADVLGRKRHGKSASAGIRQ